MFYRALLWVAIVVWWGFLTADASPLKSPKSFLTADASPPESDIKQTARRTERRTTTKTLNAVSHYSDAALNFKTCLRNVMTDFEVIYSKLTVHSPRTFVVGHSDSSLLILKHEATGDEVWMAPQEGALRSSTLKKCNASKKCYVLTPLKWGDLLFSVQKKVNKITIEETTVPHPTPTFDKAVEGLGWCLKGTDADYTESYCKRMVAKYACLGAALKSGTSMKCDKDLCKGTVSSYTWAAGKIVAKVDGGELVDGRAVGDCSCELTLGAIFDLQKVVLAVARKMFRDEECTLDVRVKYTIDFPKKSYLQKSYDLFLPQTG